MQHPANQLRYTQATYGKQKPVWKDSIAPMKILFGLLQAHYTTSAPHNNIHLFQHTEGSAALAVEQGVNEK